MSPNKFRIISVIIAVLALTCVVISMLMTYAEIGLSDSVQSFPWWLQGLAQYLVIFYKPFIPIGKDLVNFLHSHGVKNNLGDYAYVVFLGVALLIASIAIGLIGREDACEKTVIPEKK